MAERVERALRQADLWNEVKDRLNESGPGLSGGSSSGSASLALSPSGPEVLLMDEPASALDPISTAKVEDLDLGAEEAADDRHRDAQHAAGREDLDAHRLLLMGRLVEVGDTTTIFTRPAQRETEDYITGRFG